MKAETLEEKLIYACGFKKAKEIIDIVNNHFRIDKMELENIYSKVSVTSDNSLIGTEVRIGNHKEVVPVRSIQWFINGPDEIGQLKLAFL